MYGLLMVFYKEGSKYKTIKLEDFQYAKDVDKKIRELIKKEYGKEPVRDSLRYIYDVSNNPVKVEYKEDGRIVKWDNAGFFYSKDFSKYYSYTSFLEDDHIEYVHIGVKKKDAST